jgi:type II secretory pathway component GspD/PulD (secretin)
MTKTLTWTIALGLFGLSGTALGRSEITSVSYKKDKNGVHTLEVVGTKLAKPTMINLNNRSTTIFEFETNLRTERGRIEPTNSTVSNIQYGWYSANPPRVRFAFKWIGAFAPSLRETKTGWTISFGGKAVSPVTAPLNPKPVTTTTSPKATTPRATVSNGYYVPELPVGESLPLPGEKGAPKAASTNYATGTATLTAENTAKKSDTLVANQRVNASPTPTFAAGDVSAEMAQMVSLDFVNTDIVQIMKALSIQSGVNIVSSPDVSPMDKPVRVTVSLNKVTLDEALTYITAIANLRYAKVGNTYIVTPSANFSAAMRQVMERMGGRYETRVVNLVSGQAQKIKEAVEKAISPAGQRGFYEVIVPTASDLPGVALTPTPAAQGADEGQPAQPAPEQAKPSGRIYYLMVVGDPSRVSEVESYIRDLDARIADSSSFSRKSDMGTVVIPVQSGETGRIKLMIDRLVAEHPRAAEFSVQESILEGAAKGDPMTMTLLMVGPKDDVMKLESFAKSLDKELCAVMGKTFESDLAGLEKVYEVVDLRYAEPSLVELDLKTRFKGLQVSLLPDPVTPKLKGSTSSSETGQGATGGGAGAGDPGQGAAGDGGTEQSAETKTEERTITGREPMRIVLRGTRSQIDEAKGYLALIDVAPRQIALELRVLEMTQEEALRLGIDWSAITGGRMGPIRVNQGLGDAAITPGTISGGDRSDQGDIPGQRNSFLATLDKLDFGRRMIARPNALVSDGRSTRLFVGDTVRYVKSVQSTQNGTTVETDEVQVGVLFDINARVGGDGQIALDLNQNFNILTGFTPVPGGGNLPQTSDRLTSMFVNMQSGETLALGGLILEQDRKRANGIPLLKDLPIIGMLFKRTDNTKIRTEIVFFLTATEVNAGNRGNAASPGTSLGKVSDPLGDYQRSRAPKGSGGGVRH